MLAQRHAQPQHGAAPPYEQLTGHQFMWRSNLNYVDYSLLQQ
jgi:hypothetical protein